MWKNSTKVAVLCGFWALEGACRHASMFPESVCWISTF